MRTDKNGPGGATNTVTLGLTDVGGRLMTQRTPLDLTGQRFGMLVATHRDVTTKGRTKWLCRCDCGATKSIRMSHLRSGASRSCGCVKGRPPHADVTGRKFGKLTAIRRLPQSPPRVSLWECDCDCGGRTVAPVKDLNRGHTRSCGCLIGEIGALRRGTPMTDAPTYRTVHSRLAQWRGKAANFSCVDCGEPADEWSYDGTDPGEITDERGLLAYSTNLDHYHPRCFRCHAIFDDYVARMTREGWERQRVPV